MPGVDLRLDAGLRMLETELAPEIASWTPSRWRPDNPNFGAFDGDVLFAMLRILGSERVVEIGAGWSTLCVADAGPSVHEIYDPFPIDMLRDFDVRPISALEIPLTVFEELRKDDVLFIDTTHTVKPGSDVNHLLLDVLPRLQAGVVIHIHDFFRPFEYPRVLMEQYGVYWQEQYLVQAMLIGGGGYEVILANHALARLHFDRVRAVVPALSRDAAPSSLWLRKL